MKEKEPPQKYRLGTISNTKLLAGLNRLPDLTIIVYLNRFRITVYSTLKTF